MKNVMILYDIFDQIYNRKNLFPFIAELNVIWLRLN